MFKGVEAGEPLELGLCDGLIEHCGGSSAGEGGKVEGWKEEGR